MTKFMKLSHSRAACESPSMVMKQLLFSALALQLAALPAAALEPPGPSGGAPEKFFIVYSFQRDVIVLKNNRGEKRMEVEIAQSPQQQQQGLMYRSSLAEDDGMLFLFDEDRDVEMWMKDTAMPLDMLFIDRHGTIVHIAHAVQPFSDKKIGSHRKVRAVLELPGGTAAHQRIQQGDTIVYKAFKP